MDRRVSDVSDIFEDAEEAIEAEEFQDASQRAHSEVACGDKQAQEYLLYLVKKHCKKNPVFVNAKTDEEILAIFKELETWEPPEYLRKNFPYYYSGRSANGNPIWIVEAGKFDVRALVNQGSEVLKAIDKSIMKALQIAVRSMFTSGNKPELRKIQGLADLEGMHFGKLASPAAMSLIITYTKRYKELGEELLGEGVVINANQVVEYMVNKLRPLISKVLKKVKIYGKDETIWRPRLQRSFPDDALPETYGGSLRDQPLYVLQHCNLYQKMTFGRPLTV